MTSRPARCRSEFPEPVGVFRAVSAPCYDEQVHGQIQETIAKKGEGKFEELFASEDTWVVEEEKK